MQDYFGESINKMKRQPMKWEKIIAKEAANKGLILKIYKQLIKFKIKNNLIERPSRCWKSKTWRSPSSPQIHQKYIYVWNNSYRTPTEHWQKTSDFPKDKKLPTYLGKAKEKRKTTDKRIGTGPPHQGGSCEEGKVSTHKEGPSLVDMAGGRGKASEP